MFPTNPLGGVRIGNPIHPGIYPSRNPGNHGLVLDSLWPCGCQQSGDGISSYLRIMAIDPSLMRLFRALGLENGHPKRTDPILKPGVSGLISLQKQHVVHVLGVVRLPFGKDCNAK